MPNVTVRLNTRACQAQTQEAIRRLLARVATDTATGAAASAERKTGFMASTVGATLPGQPGRPGTKATTADGARASAGQPAAGMDEAYAFVAATYALFEELKRPFLLPAWSAVLANIARICAEEGV